MAAGVGKAFSLLLLSLLIILESEITTKRDIYRLGVHVERLDSRNVPQGSNFGPEQAIKSRNHVPSLQGERPRRERASFGDSTCSRSQVGDLECRLETYRVFQQLDRPERRS